MWPEPSPINCVIVGMIIQKYACLAGNAQLICPYKKKEKKFLQCCSNWLGTLHTKDLQFSLSKYVGFEIQGTYLFSDFTDCSLALNC